VSAQDRQALQALAKLQHLINTNQSLFDSVETISVLPKCEMIRGNPDWRHPYIEVRARRLDDLKKRLPADLEGIPIRVVPATLYEQGVRAMGLIKSNATPAMAALAWRTGLLDESVEARDYSGLTYESMVPTELNPVDEPMALILHVSPEAGWSELQPFLQTSPRWTIGMYDFTAPHIIDRVEAAVTARTGEISIVLDPKVSLPSEKQRAAHPNDPKAKDRTEVSLVDEYKQKFGDRFHLSWASIGTKAQFPSAYHIKVAVRDKAAFWLSSGNWQSSNQPEIDFLSGGDGSAPTADAARTFVRYNREWHVICGSAKLAKTYDDYIQRDLVNAEGSRGPKGSEGGVDEAVLLPGELPDEDFVMQSRILEEALAEPEVVRLPMRFFPPRVLPADNNKKRKVQPLLTPDNYADMVLPLLRGSSKRLWFQNQSLSVIETRSDKYDQLLETLKQKTWDVDDCKIIFRDYIQAQTMDYLRTLKEFGFNMDRVLVMKNCHTKGILIDSHWTVIGSHNWTNEGTTYNRDASLIFEDDEITGYFEQVFSHDWENLAYSLEITDESLAEVLFPGEGPTDETLRLPLNPNNDGSDA
jgi:hypothetical protein